MEVTQVSGIERVPSGASSILRRFNDGVFICTCHFHSAEYNCWTKHAFVYDIHFKPLHKSKCCGVLIDNRAGSPIFVLEDKERATKKNLGHDLI